LGSAISCCEYLCNIGIPIRPSSENCENGSNSLSNSHKITPNAYTSPMFCQLGVVWCGTVWCGVVYGVWFTFLGSGSILSTLVSYIRGTSPLFCLKGCSLVDLSRECEISHLSNHPACKIKLYQNRLDEIGNKKNDFSLTKILDECRSP